MTHHVTLLAGDSIGPRASAATQRLLSAAAVDITWHETPCGEASVAAGGEALPAAALDAVRAHKVALKGQLRTAIGSGKESSNVALRKALDLYAAVRPLRTMPGATSRYDKVDFTVVREATEDVYAGIEHRIAPGIIQGIKVTTRRACERIVRHGFAVARREGRTKLTLIHKANIMKKADGLFLAVGKEIAPEFPDIAFDAMIADNACMQLVRKPEQFQVLVAQNLFGDLLSDLGAGLVGGVAHVHGVLEGDGGVRVFEAIHGIDPKSEGTDGACPLPFFRAGSALLRHLGEAAAAERVDSAIAKVLGDGLRARAGGGTLSTEAFTEAVIARLG
jgi:isocitrate dehydrogenase (NAD+)